MEHVPPERIVVAPDCGMKYLPRDAAYGKLCAMVEGAKIVRRSSARNRTRRLNLAC
jgi:5-methyltetrahydropteroyltriglutamate--homocysteine methyltransferase